MHAHKKKLKSLIQKEMVATIPNISNDHYQIIAIITTITKYTEYLNHTSGSCETMCTSIKRKTCTLRTNQALRIQKTHTLSTRRKKNDNY